MHNVERGIIKWAPFNSVVSGNEMLNSIVKEKNKIAMPTLSDEQKEVIEKKLILALYSQNIVNIYYFQNGKILNIKSYLAFAMANIVTFLFIFTWMFIIRNGALPNIAIILRNL